MTRIGSKKRSRLLPGAWPLCLLVIAFINLINSPARCSSYYTVEQDERQKSDPAQSWRFKYYDEQAAGFNIKVKENSLDERVANVIYTLLSARPVSVDFFSFNSGDPRQDALNMDLVAGPQVDTKVCGHHLGEMLELLDELKAKLASARNASQSTPEPMSLHFDEKHLRLARVLDSYGRYESGLLSGKTHLPGAYDQCVSTNLLLSSGAVDGAPIANDKPQEVGAGYCWARLDLKKHLNADLKSREKSSYETGDASLMVGVCLPRTCHSKTFVENRELIQRLVDSQFTLPESLFIEQTLQVVSLYCLVDKESAHASWPLSGWLALTFFLGWPALALCATLANKFKSGLFPRPFLECLDLRRSWQNFVGSDRRKDYSQRSRRVDLSALDPTKVLVCVYVVLGHSFILRALVAQNGLKAYHQIENDPVVLMMIVGTVGVDTFFVITGILMGYGVMKQASDSESLLKVETGVASTKTASRRGVKEVAATGRSSVPASCKEQRKKLTLARIFFTQWLKFTVTRHSRLVPLFFLVFWFKKSVLINYFSSWPLWDAGFNNDTNYGSCRLESWITPFTVMAAFLPLSRQCFPQAWSLANDLFFSMIVPPVMLIMPRKPKVALAMSVTMIAISTGWTLDAYRQVDPHMARELSDLRTHGFAYMFGPLHHLYTYPHFRVCSVLIGLMAGYWLYLYDKQSYGLNEWPSWFKGAATKWSVATVLLIICGFSSTPYLKHYIAPNHQSLIVSLFTSGRIVWALSNAVLLVRVASDWRHNFLNQLFPGRFWHALVKLNFAILLIHMDVIQFFLASRTTLDYFSKQSVLSGFAQAYFYCVPLAILLHVVYETPINNLIKRFLIPKLFA